MKPKLTEEAVELIESIEDKALKSCVSHQIKMAYLIGWGDGAEEMKEIYS